MRRGDFHPSSGPDGSGGADEVRFGASRPQARTLPGWLSRLRPHYHPRLLIAGAAALAAAALALAIMVTAPGHVSVPPRPRPTQRPAQASQPRVPSLTRLGIQGGWELVGYGRGWLVRIRFATGQVIKTAVPGIASSGPVTFVVGPHQAVIRPLDFVPGYLIQDGRPARQLVGALGTGGTVIPGPKPGTAWVQAGFQVAELLLVRLDSHGTTAGVRIRLPAGGPGMVLPDGQGYALYTALAAGTLYDVRPGSIRKIAGTLAAVGPTELLMVTCRPVHHCSNVVVDQATGVRHVLFGLATPLETGTLPGVIAPDGSALAVIRAGRGGQLTLHLFSLESGADRRIGVQLDQGSADGQTLAWSPDSRWLFIVTANGKVAVLNARTLHVDLLGAELPAISRIAIRG